MASPDAYTYKNKHAVVVGGASGMGAAVAELVRDSGGTVTVLDRVPVSIDGVATATVDLSDEASIGEAAAAVAGPVDALFGCAGVADGTPGIERINFLGHRKFIDLLIDNGSLGRGSAIGLISSAAGFGWEQNLELIEEYLAIKDFSAAAQWASDHDKATYMWSKLALSAYVASEAFALLTRGIRINAVLPGPTDTPLAQANTWLPFGSDYRDAVGVAASTPLDQAYPLAFLCSDAAVAITGATLTTDVGYFAAGVSGSFPPARGVVDFFRSTH